MTSPFYNSFLPASCFVLVVSLPLHTASWVCIPLPAQTPGSLLVYNNIGCEVHVGLPAKSICSFLLAHQLTWLVRLSLVIVSIFSLLDVSICIFCFWLPFFHSVSQLTTSIIRKLFWNKHSCALTCPHQLLWMGRLDFSHCFLLFRSVSLKFLVYSFLLSLLPTFCIEKSLGQMPLKEQSVSYTP